MAETDNEKQNVPDVARDQVVVRHPSGQSEKVSAPEYEEKPIRIGRELDNDIVLTDPRASRYHAEIRRAANGNLEIKDLDSANGVFMGTNRIKANIWEKIEAGQTVQMGETRIFWEKAASGQSTVAMKPAEREAIAAATASAAKPAAAPAPQPPPQPQEKKEEKSPMLPLLIGIGVLVLLLLLGGIAAFFFLGGDGAGDTPQVAEGATEPAADAEATPAERSEGSDLNQQALDSAPTETPTPSGPQLAIPVVNFRSSEVRPIFLRALPSTDRALLVVDVRLQNVGNIPYTVEIEDFSLRDESGQVYEEAGGTTTEEGLNRLGVKDRFDGLNLTPGGSVPETLIFELEPDQYNFELVYEPADLDPITLNLGIVNVERELAIALGTPVEEDETPETLAAVEEEEEDATPTPEPTPTATRPAAIPAPQVVPRSALAGTIAYPVFNGNDYDIYLGDVESGTTQFYRGSASQPDFNVDGSRIAFHSWSGESRGLVTMDVSGANAALIANFVEDQLPTWTADSDEIIFLSRRTGNRASELYVTDASTELGDARVIGEGEYPSIGPTGQLAFKGWGNTAFGLRVGSETMENLQTVTNADEDTAPSLSPDGQQVVFMSRREGESWEIYIANVDGSELQQLTTDEADDGLPTWSPDGNAIAFVSNRGGPWAVWAMTPDGAGKRQVFTMEGSPDGQVGSDTYASRGWAEERISWTAAQLVASE